MYIHIYIYKRKNSIHYGEPIISSWLWPAFLFHGDHQLNGHLPLHSTNGGGQTHHVSVHRISTQPGTPRDPGTPRGHHSQVKTIKGHVKYSTHLIGLREKLQENPLFHGTMPCGVQGRSNHDYFRCLQVNQPEHPRQFCTALQTKHRWESQSRMEAEHLTSFRDEWTRMEKVMGKQQNKQHNAHNKIQTSPVHHQ